MRYMGNKLKLINEIKSVLEEKDIYKEGLIFCDLFSGTCTVGDNLKDIYSVIANDSLYCCNVIAKGKLKYDFSFFEKLGFDPFFYFNNINTDNYTIGFCYNNFAPTISGRQYFSDENAKKIDFIRDTIDLWYEKEVISDDEKSYLIGSLLESLSKVSNVAGVYSAFLKIWDSRALKKMEFIPLEMNMIESIGKNEVYNEDALELVSKISGDILYIDPPYTSTQYISQYHVLETIARNDKPITHGVGAHRDNGNQISNWCSKNKVYTEFEELIKNSRFKHILFSYSDGGIMPKEFIEKVLKRYAKDGTYLFKEISFSKYKSTRAVNREKIENTRNKEHFEWLFYIEKKEEVIYNSPLNYIGGKSKSNIINFLVSNMPKDINTFYDLFGGGANVSLNVKCNNIVYNDINNIVVKLLNDLAENDISNTINYLYKTIKKYNLEKCNKENYIAFRTKYNSLSIDKRNSLDLFLLICYGFEHQIRFNTKLEFNNPCGNSSFNTDILEKLISYWLRVKEINLTFNNKDYSEYESEIMIQDFVYCDPPYLNSCGSYNDGKRGFNGWDKEQEIRLLNFLESLDKKGVSFMLSNMKDRNGEVNQILFDWIKKNNFTVIELDKAIKRNRQKREEIIIINYKL